MKVLVTGAGIVGLALTRALAASGIQVTLIEKHTRLSALGSGICLPANAVQGLKQLGLYPELMARAHQVETITYAKHDGSVLARASLKQPPLDQAPFVALLRSDLLSLLSEQLPVSIQFNKFIQRIEQNDQGVEVFYHDIPVSEQFDLVVVAEGAHSSTRELIFTNQAPVDLGVTNWRFVVQNDNPMLQPVYYVGDDHAFMIYPISSNQAYCYAQIADPTEQYAEQDSSTALKEIFKHYGAEVQSAIRSPLDIYPGRLESVSPKKAVDGRVVLVGDALHGCPPSLQQGVGMGLEDVAELQSCLASAGSIDQALLDFEQNRLPRVQWVVSESNRIIRLANKGNSWLGRLIRNFIIRKNGPANVVAWRKLLSES